MSTTDALVASIITERGRELARTPLNLFRGGLPVEIAIAVAVEIGMAEGRVQGTERTAAAAGVPSPAIADAIKQARGV